jgi:hypothetical protein
MTAIKARWLSNHSGKSSVRFRSNVCLNIALDREERKERVYTGEGRRRYVAAIAEERRSQVVLVRGRTTARGLAREGTRQAATRGRKAVRIGGAVRALGTPGTTARPGRGSWEFQRG